MLIFQHFHWSSDNILERFVTVDVTWLQHHNPETKQQFMSLQKSGSQKKFKSDESQQEIFVGKVFMENKKVFLLTDRSVKQSM